MNNTLLIIVAICVLINIVILTTSVVNSISIASIGSTINTLDIGSVETIDNILYTNWDIIVTCFISTIGLSTVIFPGIRQWYGTHKIMAVGIFIIIALLASTPVLVKRLLLPYIKKVKK